MCFLIPRAPHRHFSLINGTRSGIFNGASDFERKEVSKATQKLGEVLTRSNGSLNDSAIKHDTDPDEATTNTNTAEEQIEPRNVITNDGQRDEDGGKDKDDDEDQSKDGKEEQNSAEDDEEPKDNFLDQLLLMSHQDMWNEIAVTWEKFVWVRKVFQHLPSETVLRIAHKRRLGPPPGQSLCAGNTNDSIQRISSSYPIKTISGGKVCD